MIFSIFFFDVYFFLFTILIFLFYKGSSKKIVAILEKNRPVSILIAARNEAHNIERCLQSILNLSYPQELIEVLIGNDGSTDNTKEVILNFISCKPNFRLIDITENLGQARGKGNVLAHLSKEATSGFFFITDADVALPENWIETMLTQTTPEVGIATGITIAKGRGVFAKMQSLDWMYSLGLIQVVSELGIPVTTMGNNMLITREAYESTGGYENLPFSITEDIQLFKEVLKHGSKFRNVYQPEAMAFTKPIAGLLPLMHQRKRWMRGLIYLPLIMKAVLIIYATFYAVLIPFFWDVPVIWAWGILFLKWLYQSAFLKICLNRINLKASFTDYILFEVYQLVLSVLMILFYFLPVQVNWKGRKY